ncbi:MAG: hypothetical protein GKS01_13570 [Alphaproteobacteria bacterium]|nr:hypothetical protein [Alphaproteobacteria bacterium]
MKFLAFNLAVGVALVFLFTADKGDVHKAVDRAHNLAADIKQMAKEKVGHISPPKVTEVKPTPVASVPVAKPTAQPAAEPAKPVEAVPLAPVLAEKQTASAPPVPPAVTPPPSAVPSPTKAGGAPSTLDPAVAKRRAEVLSENPIADPTPVLKKGDKLMSVSDRRRELLSLAEEMELLYAKSVSR